MKAISLRAICIVALVSFMVPSIPVQKVATDNTSQFLIGQEFQSDLSSESVESVLEKASAISEGGYHTCALTNNGGVKCWGANGAGQLGDGTNINRKIPVDVVGLGSGVTALSLGYYHTCALTNSGAVKCWGYNEYGQLGDGTTENRNIPLDVVGLGIGMTAISADGMHTCGITSNGGGKCWGSNGHGQLGDGTTTQRLTPVDVVGLASGVMAISTGRLHTCVLTSSGGAKCWGYNQYGQLGDGTTSGRHTPVDVVDLADTTTALSLGDYHTCALTNGAAVKCWGYNEYGQLGDGTTENRNIPLDVVGLGIGMTAISAGGMHTCGITSNGGGKCWGSNGYGQLGDGMTTQRLTPVDVINLAGTVTEIGAGWAHTCALTNNGGVQCWGDNIAGQLGDGNLPFRQTPVDVVGLAGGVTAISGGVNHTCAVISDSGVKCWGWNYQGRLGDGTTDFHSTPVEVVGLGSEMAAIEAGEDQTCGLTSSGGVKCWGGNQVGQLGDGTTSDRYTPVDVVSLASIVTAVSADGWHSCALTSSGGVKCWGWNYSGQLGDGTTTDRYTPVDVVSLVNGVTAISIGRLHTCVLTSSNGAKCWGNNERGQLGDGTTTNRYTPMDVVDLASGVTAISAGWAHTCALMSNGGVKCWGDNSYGQLGDGTVTHRNIPVDVVGLAREVMAISAGGYYTCALMSNGGVKCWGDNSFGQLGDGTTTDRYKPMDVVDLASRVTAVSAGRAHTCALTSDGGAKCWGDNHYGQIGDGTAGYSTTPVDVVGFDTGYQLYFPVMMKMYLR